MSGCLDEKLIAKYVAGLCFNDEVKVIEEHLSKCESCRKKVEEFKLKKSNKEDFQENEEEKTKTEITPVGAIQEDPFRTQSMPDVSVYNSKDDTVAQSLETMTDGYTVIGILPRGGQAVVYKATQRATNRTVAVKVLLQGQHAPKHAKYRFEQEIELVAKLKHPNIVTIYDSGIAEGQYYYAMEYIQGMSLDHYVEETNLSNRQIIELFGRITSAVSYAHQHGIIHRDLKPGNILVDDEGQPHILDFGLAKLADGFESSYEKTVINSLAGQLLGTLAFMSPEQATAKPESIDVRTDVYSLGVILYKVLTGKFPYPIGGPMFDILQTIKQTEPIRPSKLVSKLNSEVEAIILKTLAKEPGHRYQSAIELHRDIRCWLEGLPILARSDSSLYVLRKLVSRHRYASSVAALLMIIILSFAFISFDLYRSARNNYHKWKQVAVQYENEYTKDQELSQKVIFNLFIESWISDESKAEGLLGLFNTISNQNPKLLIAAKFLLNKQELSVKEIEFRKAFIQKDSWFADYVIGEVHLKAGNTELAEKMFKSSSDKYSSLTNKDKMPEDWLVERIQSRLVQLKLRLGILDAGGS